jgi:hypothetical protein
LKKLRDVFPFFSFVPDLDVVLGFSRLYFYIQSVSQSVSQQKQAPRLKTQVLQIQQAKQTNGSPSFFFGLSSLPTRKVAIVRCRTVVEEKDRHNLC